MRGSEKFRTAREKLIGLDVEFSVLADGDQGVPPSAVREFVELAFANVSMSIEWRGKGTEEIGVCKKTSQTLVRIDPRYFCPSEVDHLRGDASKARKQLGWSHRTSFKDLVKVVDLAGHNWESRRDEEPQRTHT